MEGIFVIVTRNEDLFSAWRAQLPANQFCDLELAEALDPERGIARVVIVDAICWSGVESRLKDNIVVCVGQAHSRGFEEARCDRRVRLALSYEDSRVHLRQFAPILCELAERYTQQLILRDRLEHMKPISSPFAINGKLEVSPQDLSEFFEELIEDLRSKEKIAVEFRRFARRILKASFVEFMFRHGSTIRSHIRNMAIATDDPLVTYLGRYPIPLDGKHWSGPSEPLAELSARNFLALWGARLCIPINSNGIIFGLIVCGLKEDGQPYSAYELSRLYTIGKIFCRTMTICQKLEEGASFQERIALLSKCNPNMLLLFSGDGVPRTTPPAVRALIGQCKRERGPRNAYPTEDQPLRISVAYLPDVEGIWAQWEDCRREMTERAKASREERMNILRDIALTLNHEIGNSLTSLSSISQSTLSQGTPDAIQGAYISDLKRLIRLNDELSQLASILEENAEVVDMRHILEELRDRNRGVHFEIGEIPIYLNVIRRLVVFALDEILAGVLINRGKDLIDSPIAIRLRGVGYEASEVALISIRGKSLELEGVLPERRPDSTPSHGRIGVLVAREIIRLHNGSIHSGPGIEYTEILISLRQW